MVSGSSALTTDLYQLNMMQAYLDGGMTERATFELFFRKLPPCRRFLIASGLEQALSYLEGLRFSDEDLEWLRGTARFGTAFLDYLGRFRFSGDVNAMPEGTIFFPDEPVLRITAPLPEAQLVESRLLNLIHFQTLIASKAARIVFAAGGARVIDFGFRRAHGEEAGLLAARASYIAGFSGTATVEAGRLFGIPVYGTMAHSFVQAHESESEAFEHFARSRPSGLVLLIDTYDTEAGAAKVARLAPRLEAEGIAVTAVRIDSGDLGDQARKVRRILDDAGLTRIGIFASGGLDEHLVKRLVAGGAPIDGYGVGTSLTTSSDVAALDCAYKLQEFRGIARRKRSAGKATWPGAKQVWRTYDGDGCMQQDVLTLEGDRQVGIPLIEPAMRGGQRISAISSIDAIRRRAAAELGRLPEPLKSLSTGPVYPVTVSEALQDLAVQVDARTSGEE